jgi:virginiamycin B lyase
MISTLHHATEKQVLVKILVGILAFCATAAPVLAQAVAQKAAPTYVYWTNNNTGNIGRATTEGTDVNEDFITSGQGSGLGGLTVNASNIFWSTANGGSATYVGEATINGTGVDNEFINTDGDNVCGVAVDSTYIYFVGDVGTTIGRANLDGSDVNEDFIEVGTRVCGIAVTKTHIYWANYENGEIGRANINGSDAIPDFINAGSNAGIAIQGGYIYFTSNGGSGIGRVKLNGTELNQNFITSLAGDSAFLAVDSKYIFWAVANPQDNYDGTTIGRANIDGTGVNQTFITGALGPFGIAVTKGNP